LINSSSGSGPGTSYPSINYDASANTTTISNDLILGTNLRFADNTLQSTALTSEIIDDISQSKAKLSNASSLGSTTTFTGVLSCGDISSQAINDICSNIVSIKNNVATNQTDISENKSLIQTMSNQIQSLQAYDSSQTALNTIYSGNIGDLYTTKQNLLSISNKLNPAFLDSLSGEINSTKLLYLSSIASDLQTQLNSITSSLNLKANLSGPTFTGTVSGITKSMVGLANVDNTTDANKIISNATQSALDTKWNTPANATNLANVDITSSLTSLLGVKANTNGNTYTGTHNFTGATITGITGSSTITDGSLTIAKTNGLQTALDSKQSIDVSFGLLYRVRNGGTVTTSPQTLDATDWNKVVRFVVNSGVLTTGLTVRLPSTTNVPDGAWIGISVSSSATARQIQICDSAGNLALGAFNANVTTAGNGKVMIVLGGAWVSGSN
jgi:hypothetical protein